MTALLCPGLSLLMTRVPAGLAPVVLTVTGSVGQERTSFYPSRFF